MGISEIFSDEELNSLMQETAEEEEKERLRIMEEELKGTPEDSTGFHKDAWSGGC